MITPNSIDENYLLSFKQKFVKPGFTIVIVKKIVILSTLGNLILENYLKYPVHTLPNFQEEIREWNFEHCLASIKGCSLGNPVRQFIARDSLVRRNPHEHQRYHSTFK